MLTRGVALFCYAIALAGSAALAIRLFGLGLDLSLPHLPVPGPPWLANLGWLLLFAVQHTGMARARVKQAWLQVVPERLERSVYAAVSGVVLLSLSAAWQPLPGASWWHGPWWLSGLALCGGLGMSAVNLAYDHAGLFGLRQAWEQTPAEDRLQITGPYRFVRHPLMTALLVMLWGHAVMSPTLALLAGGLSGYVGVGLWFEERDLVRRFGPPYEEYRRRVPALVPWRWPHPVSPSPAEVGISDGSGTSSTTPPIPGP